MDIRDSLGSTALHVSTFQQNLAVIRLLLEHGFDPNAKVEKTGNTPLHYAVSTNNLGAARLLMQHGADSYIKNHEGQSPLEKARKEGKAEMVKILN
jgi:ankyrin repeat protein